MFLILKNNSFFVFPRLLIELENQIIVLFKIIY
jgi:hypothetical protein